MAAFETLPVELLDKIFTLACTDGGSTGRALALTSRTLCHVSERTRYQAITLVGGHALRTFARVAESRQLRVHHLFIADHDPESPYWNAPDPSWAPDEERPRRDGRRKLTHKAQAIRNFLRKRLGFAPRSRRDRTMTEQQLEQAHATGVNDMLERILGAVGPLLRTLSVVLTTTPRFILTPVPLPRLEELTLVTFGLHTHGPASPSYPRHDLPQLTRLHICDPRIELPTVLNIAPALTHLRLSGAEDPALLLIELPNPLPKSLERIDVQPMLNCHNLGIEQIFIVVIHTIHRLRTTFAHMNSIHVVFDGDWTMDRFAYSQKLARRDWFSRLEGGGGCWERAGRQIS